MITLDTTRADHLSPYGYSRDTTPTLSALAARGAVLEQLRAPIPLTTPSHATLFTGLNPPSHGVRANYGSQDRLDARFTTLAERLSAAGWDTAASVSAFPAGSAGGLAQGFSTFFEPTQDAERRGDLATDDAIGWLQARGDAPYLLWLHLFDAHGPYLPPDDAQQAVGPPPILDEPQAGRPGGPARPAALDVYAYDGELRFADMQVARLLAAARALRPDPLIVVVADHGETLTERPVGFQHGHYLYEEQLRVPGIIVGAPVLAGKRLGGLWQLADLSPTLLELLGFKVPDGLDGRSRAAQLTAQGGDGPVEAARPDAIDDADRAEVAFAESMPCTHAKGMRCGPEGPRGKMRAVRMGRWKLIFTPHPDGARFELYRLDTDPGETTDLLQTHPAQTRELVQALRAYAARDEALR